MSSNELDEIKSIVQEHERRISELEKLWRSKQKTVGAKQRKGLSIKEFILEKQPKGDVQKTLVIAYYLEKDRNLSPFNARDLEDGFREAKDTIPKNINQDVNENIKKGYMMEAKEKKDNKKAWTLTNTGEGVVENGLKAEA